jgi:hypothetical protein
MNTRSPLLRSIALCAVLSLAVAGVALAKPLAGRTYKGALGKPLGSIAVAIKVSSTGKRVTSVRISNIPLYCSGGGEAIPVTLKGGAISRSGKFTSTGSNKIKIGPLKGKVGERFKMTGTFGTHGHESGKLTTTYPINPVCGGSTRYSTKAS